MKIVLFTDKNTIRAAEILQQLKINGISIYAILIDIGKQRRAKKVGRTLKRIGIVETTRIIYKKIRQRLKWKPVREWQTNEFYRSHSTNVHTVDNFNSAECENLLSEIEPDIIILAGSRIIRKNIIRIPKVGMLNAHPGLLPQYRGMDSLRWAIYNGDPIAITIHFVDEGVDTGNILAQEPISVNEGDTIKSLKNRANRAIGRLMAETVLKLVETGRIPEVSQTRAEGKQYYVMPIGLRQETERKLSSGQYQSLVSDKQR